MDNHYTQIKVCAKCLYEEKREVPKHIAAFDCLRDWTDPCSKCGCSEIQSIGSSIPDLDREIMDIWSKDLSLCFLEQDEDLWLAQEEYLDILLEYLDREDLLNQKRVIILAALCVLVFDNTPQQGEYDPNMSVDLGNRVAKELIKRKALFETLNTDWIMDYIKEVAYPVLGLPFQKEN